MNPVLHGTWSVEQQHFFLWGEETRSPINYGRGGHAKHAPHPFAIDLRQLRHKFGSFQTTPKRYGFSDAPLVLPGYWRKVMASPEAHLPVLPTPYPSPILSQIQKMPPKIAKELAQVYQQTNREAKKLWEVFTDIHKGNP